MSENEKNSLLIVDDDTTNLTALIQIFQNDYTIYTAKNGLIAIKNAETYLPDLILLDLLMPDMTGYEVLSTLKHMEKTRAIPVIVITGLNSTGYEKKALASGAIDFVAKPINTEEIKLKVKNQMEIINKFRTQKSQ